MERDITSQLERARSRLGPALALLKGDCAPAAKRRACSGAGRSVWNRARAIASVRANNGGENAARESEREGAQRWAARECGGGDGGHGVTGGQLDEAGLRERDVRGAALLRAGPCAAMRAPPAACVAPLSATPNAYVYLFLHPSLPLPSSPPIPLRLTPSFPPSLPPSLPRSLARVPLAVSAGGCDAWAAVLRGDVAVLHVRRQVREPHHGAPQHLPLYKDPRRRLSLGLLGALRHLLAPGGCGVAVGVALHQRAAALCCRVLPACVGVAGRDAGRGYGSVRRSAHASCEARA